MKRYTLNITNAELARGVAQHIAKQQKEMGLSANQSLLNLVRAGLKQKSAVLARLESIEEMLKNGVVATAATPLIASVKEPEKAAAGLASMMAQFKT